MAPESSTNHHLATIPPTQPQTHTIILLHGRDSLATEFSTELFESQASNGLNLPSLLPTYKWVFPYAPLLPSSRFSSDISQWFDIWSVENPSEKKELQNRGLQQSITFIKKVVEEESKTVGGYEKIVLGGISQGCATAIWALLLGGQKLGGFIGFSGWLPFQEELDNITASEPGKEKEKELRHVRDLFEVVPETGLVSFAVAVETPVFLGHCVDDDVVPVGNGERLRGSLEGMGMRVEWKAYERGGHWVNEPEGVDDLVEFVRSVS